VVNVRKYANGGEDGFRFMLTLTFDPQKIRRKMGGEVEIRAGSGSAEGASDRSRLRDSSRLRDGIVDHHLVAQIPAREALFHGSAASHNWAQSGR